MMAERPEPAAAQSGAAETAQSAGDLGAFLGTLATLLRETIGRFEQTDRPGVGNGDRLIRAVPVPIWCAPFRTSTVCSRNWERSATCCRGWRFRRRDNGPAIRRSPS